MRAKIKRSDGGDFEPPPAHAASAPAAANRAAVRCSVNADCPGSTAYRGSGYCFNGMCTAGGTTIFDAPAFLFGADAPAQFAHVRSGVLGGHLRVSSLACFDGAVPGGAVSAAATPSRGFEMMAIGPLAADNDTLVVALRRYAEGMDVNSTYTYLCLSLDRCALAARPCCNIVQHVATSYITHSYIHVACSFALQNARRAALCAMCGAALRHVVRSTGGTIRSRAQPQTSTARCSATRSSGQRSSAAECSCRSRTRRGGRSTWRRVCWSRPRRCRITDMHAHVRAHTHTCTRTHARTHDARARAVTNTCTSAQAHTCARAGFHRR